VGYPQGLLKHIIFSSYRKEGRTDIAAGGNIFIDEGYRRLNGEKLARANLKIKHNSSKIEGLGYGVAINAGYNAKKDFVLWENAETGALKQSPSTANEYHGAFLTVDPFISYRKTGRFRHDLRLRLPVYPQQASGKRTEQQRCRFPFMPNTSYGTGSMTLSI
jgi:hypothetical protein